MILMILGQAEADPAAAFAAMGVLGIIMGIIGCFLVVGLLINILVCWFVYDNFQAIPEPYRKQQPGLVWLLLIPCFSLVWNFFVFPKLSESFQAYFADKGRAAEVGDCHRDLALAYSILCACTLVPYVGGLAALAALVILIIYLVKASELKKKVLGIVP